MTDRLPFEQALAAAWPPEDWRDVTILAAVSGGADSVAMLRGLCRLQEGGGGRVVAGHLHHGLRGEEADRDERFVVDLCQTLDIGCHVGRGDVARRAKQCGDGLESAARDERYEWLLDVACRAGARFVATAHTADDQIETVLHRVLRGSGIAGLAGISRTRPIGSDFTLIRPMLEIRSSEVIEYLDSLGQAYCCDRTNDELHHTRNRIRHDLLPRIRRDYNAAADGALLRLARLAGAAQAVIDPLVAGLVERAVRESASGVEIDMPALAGQGDYLVGELMIDLWRTHGWPRQAMGRRQWEELASMARGEGAAKRSFPGPILAERREERLILSLDGEIAPRRRE